LFKGKEQEQDKHLSLLPDFNKFFLSVLENLQTGQDANLSFNAEKLILHFSQCTSSVGKSVLSIILIFVVIFYSS